MQERARARRLNEERDESAYAKRVNAKVAQLFLQCTAALPLSRSPSLYRAAFSFVIIELTLAVITFYGSAT